MPKQNSNRAILVLESPWGLDETDSNRSSVLPFIEGIAKYAGDMEVCHANFYDTRSFKLALNCLCKSTYANAIVYIAAHGSPTKIGGVPLTTVLQEIGQRAKDHNITGVLLGSCDVGSQVDTMARHIQGTALRWCAGYGSGCEWMVGTLIDCSILSQMVRLDREHFMHMNSITEAFGQAITPFALKYKISGDEGITLEKSLCVVAQTIGQGSRAKNITEDVIGLSLLYLFTDGPHAAEDYDDDEEDNDEYE